MLIKNSILICFLIKQKLSCSIFGLFNLLQTLLKFHTGTQTPRQNAYVVNVIQIQILVNRA